MKKFAQKSGQWEERIFADYDSVKYSMIMSRTPRILAFAGGKGGVGKTIVASMLGICLSCLERRTILIDLDFNGSNLLGYLNMCENQKSLKKYFEGRSNNLTDFLQPTQFDNLDAIVFHSNLFEPNNVKFWQRQRLFYEIRRLKADYVILDLGTATSNFALDTILFADDSLFVTTNDVFSIQNTYSLLRSTLMRKLKSQLTQCPSFVTLLNECGLLVDGKDVKPITKAQSQIRKLSRDKFIKVNHIISSFRPKLLLNCYNENESIKDFLLLGSLAKDLLDIELSYWGKVRFDLFVREAVRNLRPEMLLRSSGCASSDILKIAVRNLIAYEIIGAGIAMRKWPSDELLTKGINNSGDELICHPGCYIWENCIKRRKGLKCSKIPKFIKEQSTG